MLSMGKSRSPKLIAIVGPTASGKTTWALELARECNAEIVSADSRQVYRGMDIGTSKPVGTWHGETYLAQNIPYHLVDVVDPDEAFTLAHYQKRTYKTIDTILARQKLPLLVGGTGLYVQAIIDNLNIPAVAPNEALRERLAKKSPAELAAMLKTVDPETADAVDPKNPRRLIRAIETALAAKSARKQRTPRYDTLQIGVAKPKDELYAAIDARVDEMIEAGLAHEVEMLLSRYPRTIPAFSGIGYAEVIQYLDGLKQSDGLFGRPDLPSKSGLGAITLENTIRLIKTHTRQYARRQLTWFKRDKRIHWLSSLDRARKLIHSFLR